MTQPVPRVESVDDPERVLAAVGAGRSLLPVELYDNGARHIIVTLSEDDLAGLRPDGAAIASLVVTGINCIARGVGSWRNRMLWEHGEDAATGSAAGPIACHLARHGLASWGEEIVIAQGIEIGRPSTLHARATGGDGLIDAVEVGGSAVVVARGEFRL
jgi:trans-2,3-dihydro-3-hydroxyanthranilate isomerase